MTFNNFDVRIKYRPAPPVKKRRRRTATKSSDASNAKAVNDSSSQAEASDLVRDEG